MHDEYCNCCPDWNDDKNCFQPENRFVGDIEDGKRYPFGVYTKDEEDAKFQTITDRLDALEYTPIQIAALNVSKQTVEFGDTVDITISWELNKETEEQTLNGEVVTGTSKTFKGISSSTTFVLTASDGKTLDTKSVSVSFANRIYYGTSSSLENVTDLSSVVSNQKSRDITVNSGAGKYIIYAVPARLGQCVFSFGGIEGGFNNPVLQEIINSHGYREQYYIYKSVNSNLGTTTISIR